MSSERQFLLPALVIVSHLILTIISEHITGLLNLSALRWPSAAVVLVDLPTSPTHIPQPLPQELRKGLGSREKPGIKEKILLAQST